MVYSLILAKNDCCVHIKKDKNDKKIDKIMHYITCVWILYAVKNEMVTKACDISTIRKKYVISLLCLKSTICNVIKR